MAKKYKRRKMAMGGNIPVELEGGEMFELPGMEQGMEVQGPTHAQGGVDMNLPSGTQVYSDRISIDGKTLSERKSIRDRKLNKLEKLLETDEYDSLKRNTATRSKQVIDMEDQLDTSIMDAVSQPQQQFAYGGVVGNPLFNQEDQILAENNIRASSRYKTPYMSAQIPTALSGIGQPVNASVLQPIQGLGVQTLPVSSDVVSKVSSIIPTNGESSNTTDTTNVDINTDSGDGSNFGEGLIDAFGGPIGLAGAGIGLSSALFGAFSGIANTKANLNATKNLNKDYYEDFGLEAILTNKKAQDRVQQNKVAAKREADRKLAIEKNTQRGRNRGSAVGINQLRALDMLTDLGIDRATVEGVNNAEQIYGNQLLQLLGQETQLKLERDKVTMGSKSALQDAEEQRLDNYYTQMGEDLSNIATMGMGIGRNINQIAKNYNELGWLSDSSQYFDATAGGTANKRKRTKKSTK